VYPQALLDERALLPRMQSEARQVSAEAEAAREDAAALLKRTEARAKRLNDAEADLKLERDRLDASMAVS
jgi:hypothetical protein